MWLLDVNVPRQTVTILSESGMVAHHAVTYGWSELTNGDLVEAASAAGFTCIVTRDKQFAESASRALRRFPQFAVVLLDLPQLRQNESSQQYSPRTRYRRGMTALLDEALRRVAALPQADQDFIASRILETLDDDEAWSRSFREKPHLLEALATEAVAEHRKGETRPLDELLG